MSNERLDFARVDRALRSLISDLDYDLHKSLECDEETGDDEYPAITSAFIDLYSTPEESI